MLEMLTLAASGTAATPLDQLIALVILLMLRQIVVGRCWSVGTPPASRSGRAGRSPVAPALPGKFYRAPDDREIESLLVVERDPPASAFAGEAPTLGDALRWRQARGEAIRRYLPIASVSRITLALSFTLSRGARERWRASPSPSSPSSLCSSSSRGSGSYAGRSPQWVRVQW
jgi:hypothetical protein